MVPRDSQGLILTSLKSTAWGPCPQPHTPSSHPQLALHAPLPEQQADSQVHSANPVSKQRARFCLALQSLPVCFGHGPWASWPKSGILCKGPWCLDLASRMAPTQVRGVRVDPAVSHLWGTLRKVSLRSPCPGTGSSTPSRPWQL